MLLLKGRNQKRDSLNSVMRYIRRSLGSHQLSQAQVKIWQPILAHLLVKWSFTRVKKPSSDFVSDVEDVQDVKIFITSSLFSCWAMSKCFFTRPLPPFPPTWWKEISQLIFLIAAFVTLHVSVKKFKISCWYYYGWSCLTQTKEDFKA